jgi:hypothetical protein
MRRIGLAVVLAVGLFPAPLAALKEMGRVVTPWVSAEADRRLAFARRGRSA